MCFCLPPKRLPADSATIRDALGLQAKIDSKMTPLAFPAREAVIQFGETADSLYVVRDGLIAIKVPPEHRSPPADMSPPLHAVR